MCCGPTTSARILGLLSVVIAIGLVGTSAWVFRDYYEQYESQVNRAAGSIISSIDKALGTNVAKYGPKQISIFVYCSGVTMAVGGLQILTSIFLLISGGGKSRAPGCTYSLVNTVGVTAVIAALVCITYQGYVNIDNFKDRPENEQYWFAVMIINIVFYTVGSCIAGCFTRNN